MAPSDFTTPYACASLTGRVCSKHSVYAACAFVRRRCSCACSHRMSSNRMACIRVLAVYRFRGHCVNIAASVACVWELCGVGRGVCRRSAVVVALHQRVWIGCVGVGC